MSIFGTIREPKIGLAASLKGKGVNSVRDFGGMWKVNGLYLIEAVKALHPVDGQMVDNFCTEEFKQEAAKVDNGKNTLEYIKGDFREIDSLKLEPVDVSLFYDVLLHQDNFTDVIKRVTKLTNKYICVAQPFYEGFNRPDACSLIQFMTPKEKEGMSCYMWDTIAEPVERFSVDIWMWAQSLRLITDVFKGYGWVPVPGGKTFDFPMQNQWHYTGLIFQKA